MSVSRDCPIFWVPLLSQERVKLRTSNFVGTFIGSIGRKAHENVGNSGCGRSQGVPKIFRALICMGALRGHLCGSTAFLLQTDGRTELHSNAYSPACHFYPTPLLVSPKFPLVPLGVGGSPSAFFLLKQPLFVLSTLKTKAFLLPLLLMMTTIRPNIPPTQKEADVTACNDECHRPYLYTYVCSDVGLYKIGYSPQWFQRQRNNKDDDFVMTS